MSQPGVDLRSVTVNGQRYDVLAATGKNVRALLVEARQFQGKTVTPANTHAQLSCILAALDLMVERIYGND